MMGDTLPDGPMASRPRSNTLQSNARKPPADPPLQETLSLHHSELAAHYAQLQHLLERLEKTQKDCTKRVRHLEGTVSGVLNRLPVDHVKSNGDVATWETDGKNMAGDLEEQVFQFQACLERNLECVDTAMRDLVRRRLKREYVQTQTDSTSITARDVALQTIDTDMMSMDDDHPETILYVLPDLELAVQQLQIDMETQTDLQMEHFASDGNTAINRDNVVIIYRNPNFYSFLKPYFIGVGGTALGVVVLYKVVKSVAAVLRS